MALQLSEGIRNARLDAIEVTGGASCALEIRTGDQPANCATASSGTILVTMNLPADWMAAAASGAKAKAGTWQDAAAEGTGTAGHFRIYSDQTTKDGTTCIMQGDVPDDMTLDNVSIAIGQVVTITSFTLTDGNA